ALDQGQQARRQVEELIAAAATAKKATRAWPFFLLLAVKLCADRVAAVPGSAMQTIAACASHMPARHRFDDQT
ncbi:MAG: hypothetical protein KDF57_03025, partial [Ottowia sp.]|nr:hypothetical protein [Ottowia sp.]